MNNPRGPFHDLLVGHFGMTMLVVVALCILGLLASVDTLPKGQDAKQGLAGTEGSAVPEGQTPNLNSHHPSQRSE